MENNGNELLFKGLFIAFLAEVGIPIELFIILSAASVFDMITGATFYYYMGQFSRRSFLMGLWVKILLLGGVFFGAYFANKMGYETGKSLSDTFIVVMAVNDGFSGFYHIRGIKAKKKFKQLDLLGLFFEVVKKVILSQFDKWRSEQTDKDED